MYLKMDGRLILANMTTGEGMGRGQRHLQPDLPAFTAGFRRMPRSPVSGETAAKRVQGENQRISPAAVVSVRSHTGVAKMNISASSHREVEKRVDPGGLESRLGAHLTS